MISANSQNQAIFGERQHGVDVRNSNLMAVMSIANILKSSLGPQGLDKMLVDDIGEVVITNDGATILSQLEVKHPAAQILVDLSALQDSEVGDGTTTVVLLAAELLRRGTALVASGSHPSNVISGYKLALRECVRYISDSLTIKEGINHECCLNVAKTVLSSKLAGVDADYFAKLVVDAITNVKFLDSITGTPKYPVNALNILKTHGKSVLESSLVEGYALSHTSRACQGMPMSITNVKVACLDFPLKQHRMQMGVRVEIENPQELARIRLEEKEIVHKRIEKILATGCNVVLTSGGIDDQYLKYFVSAGCIAIRRVDKKDLRRIAKATGATICLTMAQLDNLEESFDPAYLGECQQVREERLGDWDYIMFLGCKTHRAASIILRGANEVLLDELERSLHDALCSVSKLLESNGLVAGGGAVETALSIYLEDFARTLGSREQLAIAEFAEALLVIPKTLAINAAKDATDLIAKLRAAHATAQLGTRDQFQIYSMTNVDKMMQEMRYQYYGLDLTMGIIRDSIQAGVLEPAISKIKSLRFATEAAITLLRIDDHIKVKPLEVRNEPE
ncbi:T-complex protein alpha subunit [Cryptosporidium andersoni]|uniref:T-complex protein 1 subunit alpha n=1 Tax=Cryptosporidium andersoni TaxID=117008 RepID=A0A1J4MT47_9CRYT|nr:T-complex protein alpha subunit [Cryptosporidium andersoni]